MTTVLTCWLFLVATASRGDTMTNDDRDVDIRVSEDSFDVRLDGADGSRISVDTRVSTGSELFRFDFEYSAATESSTTTLAHTPDEAEFRVRFESLIEYVENGVTPGFQTAEDIVIQTYTGGDGWGAWTSADIMVGFTQSSITTLDGCICVTVYVTGSPVSLGNYNLTSNKVKFDVSIINFPYQAIGDSYLALVSKLESDDTSAQFENHGGDENNMEDDDAGDDADAGDEDEDKNVSSSSSESLVSFSESSESSLLSSGDSIRVWGGDGDTNKERSFRVSNPTSSIGGFFTWVQGVDIIDANGTYTVAAVLTTTDSNNMYFTFDSPTPRGIFWDPTIGAAANTFADTVASGTVYTEFYSTAIVTAMMCYTL